MVHPDAGSHRRGGAISCEGRRRGVHEPRGADPQSAREETETGSEAGQQRKQSVMGFKCGIVGLPNVGKSTLFNALTQTAAAQAANYPFCTIEPNVGDVAVPDPRLD